MATKSTGGAILDLLGGKRWVRSVGLTVDETAPVGMSGAMALSRDVPRPKANRVVVSRARDGGFKVAYWRVDGEDGEPGNEKSVPDLDAVIAELAAGFAP